MDQNTYLEILMNDCGFSTRIERNAYLSRIFKREIKHLDDMTSGEKSFVIALLKERKENL